MQQLGPKPEPKNWRKKMGLTTPLTAWEKKLEAIMETLKPIVCRMPGCYIAVGVSEKYCPACAWQKRRDIEAAKTAAGYWLFPLIALLLMVAPVHAAALENPDRVPSLGLDWTQSRTGLALNSQAIFDPDGTHQPGTPQTNLLQSSVIADLRVPVSPWLSVTVHGGPSRLEAFNRNERGYSIGIGARVYLHNLAN